MIRVEAILPQFRDGGRAVGDLLATEVIERTGFRLEGDTFNHERNLVRPTEEGRERAMCGFGRRRTLERGEAKNTEAGLYGQRLVDRTIAI